MGALFVSWMKLPEKYVGMRDEAAGWGEIAYGDGGRDFRVVGEEVVGAGNRHAGGVGELYSEGAVY